MISQPEPFAVPCSRPWVDAHFAAYRRLGKKSFLWRISLESLLVPIALVLPLVLVFELPPRQEDLRDIRFWVGAVIIAPFVETVLLQALPVMIARRLGAGFWTQVVAGLGLFAGVHFSLGVTAGLAAGLASGFYLAFTYVHWRQTSVSAALWMTTGVHSIHNALLCTIGLAIQTVGR